jgi:hypothetical protein
VTVQVTLTYLGYSIELLDEKHLTIRTPDGWRIVSGVSMSIAGARAVIRGYRAALRDEQRTAA